MRKPVRRKPKRREEATPLQYAVALIMLRDGKLPPADIAKLVGITRQTFYNWRKDCGFDWRGAREARLERYKQNCWRRALNNGEKTWPTAAQKK